MQVLTLHGDFLFERELKRRGLISLVLRECAEFGCSVSNFFCVFFSTPLCVYFMYHLILD